MYRANTQVNVHETTSYEHGSLANLTCGIAFGSLPSRSLYLHAFESQWHWKHLGLAHTLLVSSAHERTVIQLILRSLCIKVWYRHPKHPGLFADLSAVYIVLCPYSSA